MQKNSLFVWSFAGMVSMVLCASSLQAQTWENITTNVSVTLRGDFRAMDSDGARLYMLTLTNGVYVSADNGNSFTPVNDVEGGVYGMTNKPGRFIKYLNGSMWVGWDPGSAAFAGSGPINYGAATLHRLTPGETLWHKSSAGFPVGDTGNQADDIAYDVSTGTYYVASALGGAFVSSDGSNWVQRTTGLGGLGVPATMAAFDGMAFAASVGAQVARTVNQGTNWTALQSHRGFSTGLMIEKNGRLMFISNGPDGFNYSDDHGASWHFLTNGVKQLGDLTSKNGIVYASGLIFGSVLEPFVGRPGLKFSATEGITWDNLPTSGLPADALGSLNLVRVLRQGNYLFTYYNSNGVINLCRCDVSGFDFTPTTQIAQQPPATTNFLVGQTVNLSVLAGGANLAYQWVFKGTNIAGATSATYSIPSVQTNNAGAYQVVVTGDRGSVTSSVVTLNVGLRGDGRYDLTYNNPTTGGWIYLEPDGSLVSVNGANLYKLNPTGERAITRNLGGATFFAGVLDSSNRVVLAGRFSQAPKGSRLIRASGVDLTDDATFHLPYVNGDYSVLAELPGRGYLAGGSFTTVTNSGIATNVVNHFCLIGYSGVVDTNFVFSPSISQISRIVVVGLTNIYISITANKSDIKKVNLDGTYDTNFSNVFPGNNIGYYESYVSNKLFAVVSSKPVLVNPDGTLDGSFNTANATFNNTVTAMTVGESNNLYVAGTFTTYNGQPVGKYARLFPDGTLDTSFYTESPTSGGFNWDVYDPRGYLYVVRDTSSGTFQGQSYGTGPYRLFAGTNPVASTGNPTFSQWAAQFTFPPGQNGPADDADGDGVKNIFEYYIGSNPTNAASGAQPAEITVNVSGQNYPAITFIRSQNVSGVTLLPQVSSTVNFTDSLGYTVQSVVDLGNGTEQVTIRSNISMAGQTTQFLRIQLSVP